MRGSALTLLLITALGVPGRFLFAQCSDGSPPPCRGVRAPAPVTNTVAVLPFENRAHDTSLTTLAEGVADEITTNLARVARLRVTSPASVRYALSTGARDPRRLGAAMGSRWLVDGQLVSAGGAVRVNAQLIEAANGRLRWSGSLQRTGNDLLGLIRFIADSVATGIVGELAPGERAQLAPRPTSSAVAYESYLRGRALLSQGGENYLTASAMFDAATALDSGFADAWAASATAFISIADNVLAPRAAYPRARAAAMRALRIDPANGEATAALAKITLWYDWDVPGALLLARRSVALNPASAETHMILGLSLLLRGDTAEAGGELRRAIDIDSLSGRTVSSATFALMMIGENDAAVTRTRRFLAAGAHSPYDIAVIARVFDFTGHCAEVDSLLGPGQWRIPGIMRCHPWQLLEIDSAVSQVRATAPYLRAWGFARMYARDGGGDRALELLDQAFRDREAWMPFIQYDPAFQSLRSDPRFEGLVRRVAASVGGT
ncbi:MAG TPA: hypothetical protein VGI92_02340 [Gemmatimonadales bacterium]|jgi:TolB-like protein